MAIYPPIVSLSDDDRELLRLLAEIVLSHDEVPDRNHPIDEATLTEREGERLLQLLEQFAEHRKFIEGSHFIEKLFSGIDPDNKSLQDIYFY
jgi:hypothetical protein